MSVKNNCNIKKHEHTNYLKMITPNKDGQSFKLQVFKCSKTCENKQTEIIKSLERCYENLPNEMYVRILTRDLVGTIHFLNGVI